MFCNKPKSVNRNVPGKKNKKRKKKSPQPQGCVKLRNTNSNSLNIARAMSTWAQNYTAVTTWQLKHQIAYWKSKAVALQYENRILHEMVREGCFEQTRKQQTNNAPDSSESDAEVQDESDEHLGYEEENVSDEEDDGLVVSEEFLEFLKQNAKFKENFRKEKELMKAKQEAEYVEELLHENASESSEAKVAKLKELYGDNWEKIMALETSTLCNFISECDKSQPEYWPNIPINL